MSPKLENLYFFLILDSKDIQGKQLTVNFNENLLESPLDT